MFLPIYICVLTIEGLFLSLFRSIKSFFDVEKAVNEQMTHELVAILSHLEDKRQQEAEKQDLCERALEVDQALDGKKHYSLIIIIHLLHLVLSDR